MRAKHVIFLALAVSTTTGFLTGCRGRQHALVLNDTDKDMVGTHEAGAETWKPLVNEAVGRMLGRACSDVQTVSYTSPSGVGVRKVCFVGVENRSAEPIGDFREQIYEHIDSQIGQSDHFRMISRRYVEAAMAEIRCRPDLLIMPENQRQLQAALERAEQPFDFLLFAQITSGTTRSNDDYQRDYLLTLELLDIHTGESLKESADLRKGYHKSRLAMFKQYGRRK
ncbi:MAG: penicillin-binding protein activator LpoB [Planctomycetaceae bacterium]